MYVRGVRAPVTLALAGAAGATNARQFDPRTGEFRDLPAPANQQLVYRPPDEQDWIVVVK
jgi:hypothetical protein